MHKYLKRVVDERNSLTGLMQTVTDRAAAEDREITEVEAERLRGWQERAGELDRQAGEQSEYLESARAWSRLQDQLRSTEDAEPERRAPALATRGAAPSSPASWGEAFTGSPAFQRYEGYGTSGRVEVGDLFEQRAAIDTAWLAVPHATFMPQPWTMTTPLLEACGREAVSNGTVDWVKYPNSYPLAGIVPEGSLKPESDIAPTVETAALVTYAHWKGITRQALEDIPRVQSIVENALRQGILRKIEADTAAVLLADTDIAGTVNADLLAGIREAIGVVQSNGYASPNAVLLNPADFAALDIAIMGGTLGGASVNTGFWGVKAVAVGALPAGTAYVGDLKTCLTLFTRGSTSVYMSDSHADYFIRNTLVVLAETRALPVITEPQAAQKVTKV